MTDSLGSFAIHHWKGILFMVLGLCLAGVYAAMRMPSSVFPQTDFPRVTIMIDNGEMPADEMMLKITKPVEEEMKDVPGVVKIRSETGRGSSVVDVFFNWGVNMPQTELQVRSRLQEARSELEAQGFGALDADAYRMTFSAFPIAGISLISDRRTISELTVAAEQAIKPRFLRIDGVASVDLVGSREPEFHIVADPLKLAAVNLSLPRVAETLRKSNVVAATGLHEEKDTLYLTLVDGRVHSREELADLVVAQDGDRPVRIRDFARVEKGTEPANTVVTADGREAVLIMIQSQPDGSTVDIARALNEQVQAIKKILPADMKLAFFYDQSLLVRDSVKSVWEAIFFGLILSVAILFGFLKDWGSTLVATVVIPVAVLFTLLAMHLLGMSFNLMTLGGIASAIGLIIDDAIVVVEAIHTKMATGMPRLQAVRATVGEILSPLAGSTLTPVVVFIPLAFLSGVPGVFFRALAITMTVSLMTSLLLAISLTPSLAALIIRVKAKDQGQEMEQGGFILRRVSRLYERVVRVALAHRFITTGVCVLLLLAGADLYTQLKTDLLPELEEHGFVLDYRVMPAGTSLAESNRALNEIKKVLQQTPEVESYSRRTGTALGLELTEPNAGDFLVKLRPDSQRSTAQVIAALRQEVKGMEPQIEMDWHGMLGDLIGDLVSSPQPVEIKIFSPDQEFLRKAAPAVEAELDALRINGVQPIKDTDDGLVEAGPSLTFSVRSADARRYELTTADIAEAVQTAKLGKVATEVLESDRAMPIRVMMDPKSVDRAEKLAEVPLMTPGGQTVRLSQVADAEFEPGQLELEREDQRQYVSVTGEIQGGDLGSVMAAVKAKLANDPRFPPGTIEFGGRYQQQQEASRNLMMVLLAAVLLVFTVLVMEFRSFTAPVAIIAGAVLAARLGRLRRL